MGGLETGLEVALLGMLGATLFYAVRLHRSIGGVRADRGSLDAAVAGFDSGTRQAEAGLQRLRDAAKTVSVQLDELSALKDDLVFLADRGAQVADRLDGLVRAARGIDPGAGVGVGGGVGAGAGQPFGQTFGQTFGPPPGGTVRSQAERDLLLALRDAR